jgi:hypothetical protein
VAGKEWIEVMAGSHLVMDDFQSFVKEDRILRKRRQDKGYWGRGGSIPVHDPGKPGPAYRMAAVLGAHNAASAARAKRGGES